MTDILDILQEGFSLDALVARISLPGLAATMGVALLCALLIYFTYRFFYPGVIYSASFNLLLVLITLITAMIIMTISSNIILSLGMVGALSIVRFRTAVKDPLDVGFLFLGIGAGLTAGAGLFLIAVCGTLWVLLVFVVMSRIKSGNQAFLLILTYDNPAGPVVEKELEGLRAKLKNKTLTGQTTELSLQLKLRGGGNVPWMERLSVAEGVHSVVLLEYSGEHVV